MFPLGIVPLGLKCPRAIPLGHYPTGQIPFLFPPPGVFYIYVMVSLPLLNMTFGILLCYIGSPASILPSQLRPYHALTLVQSVPMTPVTNLVPSQPQQELTPIMKPLG